MSARLLAFLALLLFLSPNSAFADKRVALLIGNSAYTAVSQLTNPAHDVETMKAAFEGAGFDKVDTVFDLGHDALIRALRSFEDESQGADVAVVYYSGHGMEMNGENYLVPVDAKLQSDRDVEDEAVSLDRVMRSVDNAKRLKLIILDACRNNPFVASMKHVKGTKGVDKGLARVEPSDADTLIAFAARAGTVASDGDDGNSPFAAALAKRLVEPGIDIRIALGNVRDDVLAATNRRQEPFAYGSLGGGQVFLSKIEIKVEVTPPVTPTVQMPGINPCADAAAHWAEAQKFDRLEFYKRHLALFGECAFADFAKLKIEEKEAQLKSGNAPPEDAIKLATLPTQQTPAGAAPATECDRLAADAEDGDRVATPVSFASIDAPRAVTACRDATKQYPTSGRLFLQLAIALDKSEDYSGAVEAYQRAVDLGSVKAIRSLADKYDAGSGVTQDQTKAFTLYTRAVDKGDPKAFNDLGFYYQNGMGTAKDVAKALDLYRRGSEKGDPKATYNYGYMFENGVGTTQDYAEAARQFQKAADLDHASATAELGYLYEQGLGVTADATRAAQLYQKASDLGSDMATDSLAYLYQKGSGVSKDLTKAVELYQKAADHGYAASIRNLGYMYDLGLGIDKDQAKAAELYRKAGDQGDATALFNLGYLYQYGEGVSADLPKAAELYQQASDKGSLSATDSLGFMYQKGLGVQEDLGKAAELYKQAADKGLAASLRNLGFLYANGLGVDKDLLKAAELYQQGADKGDATAANNLGLAYEEGRGVTKDALQALKYYNQAIDAGNAAAAYNLGLMYVNGNGIRKDPVKAVALFQKSADAGDADGMYELGFCYDAGRGVPKDYNEAAKWVVKAVASGSSFALKEMTTNFKNWEQPFRVAVQRDLIQRGVYSGPTNGNFGQATLAALRKLGSGG